LTRERIKDWVPFPVPSKRSLWEMKQWHYRERITREEGEGSKHRELCNHEAEIDTKRHKTEYIGKKMVENDVFALQDVKEGGEV